MAAMGTVAIGMSVGKEGGVSADSLDGVRTLVSSGFTGLLLAAIFGATVATNEFRHGTAAQSIVDARSRLGWFVPKLLPVALVGLLITAASEVSTLLVAKPFISAFVVPYDLWSGDLLQMFVGTVLLGLPAALAGAALGLIIRNQVFSILAIVLYQMVLEAAVLQFLPSVGKFLPGAAQAALIGDPTLPYHNAALGALVYVAWLVGLGAIGLTLLSRRDIDVNFA